MTSWSDEYLSKGGISFKPRWKHKFDRESTFWKNFVMILTPMTKRLVICSCHIRKNGEIGKFMMDFDLPNQNIKNFMKEKFYESLEKYFNSEEYLENPHKYDNCKW